MIWSRCQSTFNVSNCQKTHCGKVAPYVVVKAMACHPFGTKPLPESMLTYFHLPKGKSSVKLELKYILLLSKKIFENVVWKMAVISINTLRLGQNGHHFADDISKCIFFNETFWIAIQISLFFPRGPIANKISIGSNNGLAPNIMYSSKLFLLSVTLNWIIYFSYSLMGL